MTSKQKTRKGEKMTIIDDIKCRICDVNLTFLGINSFGKRYEAKIAYDILIPDSHEPGFNAPVYKKPDEKNQNTVVTKSKSSENFVDTITWAETEEDIVY